MKIFTNMDFQGNQLLNILLHPATTAPENPSIGQFYFNTTDNNLYAYYGEAWHALGVIPKATAEQDGLLSKEDFTKLAGIGEGAQANVIEKVTLNGEEVTPDGEKTVALEDIVTNTALATELAKYLKLDGTSIMTGTLNLGNNSIGNVADAVQPNDAVTLKQVNQLIAALGTVLRYKGSKPTYEELPKEANSIGDVWTVVELDNAEYVWVLNKGQGEWQELGKTIDLSGYFEKANIVQETGNGTDKVMSQDAVTKELAKKQDTITLTPDKVVVSGAESALEVSEVSTAELGYLTGAESNIQEQLNAKLDSAKIKSTTADFSSETTATCSFTGTLFDAYVKDAEGNKVITDLKCAADSVTATISKATEETLTLVVVYLDTATE